MDIGVTQIKASWTLPSISKITSVLQVICFTTSIKIKVLVELTNFSAKRVSLPNEIPCLAKRVSLRNEIPCETSFHAKRVSLRNEFPSETSFPAKRVSLRNKI